MTHSEIWQARLTLEKARRDKIIALMAEYDKEHRAAMKVLQDACGAIGHNLRFTHIGPFGNPWFICSACGASKVEIECEAAENAAAPRQTETAK